MVRVTDFNLFYVDTAYEEDEVHLCCLKCFASLTMIDGGDTVGLYMELATNHVCKEKEEIP